MATDKDDESIGWIEGLWRGLIVLALGLCAIGQLQTLVAGITNTAWHPRGSLGVVYSQTIPAPFWITIAETVPGGPADQAGIRVGDSLRFDMPFGQSVIWREGERVPVTVDRAGQHFRATMIAAPPPVRNGPEESVPLLFGIQGLITVALAALLLIRGWHTRVAILLAALLVAANGHTPTAWLPRPVMAPALVVELLMNVAIVYLWPVFCLRISGGASDPRQLTLVRRIALIFVAAHLYNRLGDFLPINFPGRGLTLYAIIISANQLFGYAILTANYRRNNGPGRNRIKIVVVAFIGYLVSALVQLFPDRFPGMPLPWSLVFAGGLQVFATILLSYSVLHRQHFDVGFVLNRTLVYGVVSFSLLASFGLTEWAADHFLPDAWYGAGEIYSAGIALTLFLSFHRLRDWVEHHIERLFFHKWQQNEAELRRFVSVAGHFEQIPALCDDFVRELSRFSGGAGAALYLRRLDGIYHLEAGSLDERLSEHADDDRALALMKAERQPINLTQTTSALPGVLALPMLDQGLLAGFILLDGKPNDVDYRPDEVELLGWAVHQVGLALRALRAHSLEAQVLQLREKVAWLSEEHNGNMPPHDRDIGGALHAAVD